jgi:hypothetical protein
MIPKYTTTRKNKKRKERDPQGEGKKSKYSNFPKRNSS